jgi:polysaccharide transporter, PST family
MPSHEGQDVTLRHTAAKSILWSGFENGTTSIIAFLSLVVLAKLLQPSDFGAFSVSLAVVEIAGVFTNMIFHDALIQQSIVTEKHFNSAFTVSIGLSFLIYIFLWFAFPYVALAVQDDRIRYVGRTLGLGLLITGPAGVLAAKQSREFGFRLLAMRTLAGRVGGAVLAILSACLGFGLWSLVVQHLAIMSLGAATLLGATASPRIRLTVNVRPVGDLLRYSVTATTSLAAGFISKRLFLFCFGAFLGTEIAGFLNLAFRLVDTVWAISATAVSQVLLPTLSRLQQDQSRLTKAYRISVTGASAILYPAFAGLGVLAPELIQLLFGNKWMPASLYVFALSVLTFVQIARLPAGPLLSTLGFIGDVCLINVMSLFCMSVAIALTHLKSDYVALAVWGGIEFATFAAMALALHLRLKIRLLQQLQDIFVPLLASISMIVVMEIVRSFLPIEGPPYWRLLEVGGSGVFTYIALMLVFGRQFIDPLVGMARVVMVKE